VPWCRTDRVALLLLLLLGSCQPITYSDGGGGVGPSSYAFGTQSQVQAGSFERVWAATLTALQQYQATVNSARRDGASGQIEGRLPDSSTVQITVEENTPDATTVKIRLGLFGSQSESVGIQQRISGILQAGK
jgi:hypothetical protein